MKNTDQAKLIPIMIDHVIFKITSSADKTFVQHKTLFTNQKDTFGVGNEIFFNVDYTGLSELE